jgi:heme oxygenase
MIVYSAKVKSILTPAAMSATTQVPTVLASNKYDNGKYSFVQDEMRPLSLKFHTQDQAPEHGQQPAQIPFSKWQPTRANYLQFLVDSLVVYEAFDVITHAYDVLTPLRRTGLERSEALKEDIAWMLRYDSSLRIPAVSAAGMGYASFLHRIAAESIPKFICHYYNHYFAHTAGGRMIGARMAELLLESKLLRFFQWEGDVRSMLQETRKKIDAIASAWTLAEKQACLDETIESFHFEGELMASLRPPPAHSALS